jgi:hypothetical protein
MKFAKFNIIHLFTLIIAFVLINSTNGFAQEKEQTEEPKKTEKPVRSPWEAGMLFETQTDLVWTPKTLEMVIQHRFGLLNSGEFDLLGLYAPSNIRLGINYGLFKNFNIGIGSTKYNKLQDINWKYKIFSQTKSNSMPIALTYYGNVQMDARDKVNFGPEYKFAHRVAYFNQLIVSRKFTKAFTMQVMLNHAHFNQIDTASVPDLKHSNFGLGLAGRLKFNRQGAIVFEYEQPLTTPETIKPNLSFGVELATSSHAFQVFVSTYSNISYQSNLVYNTNDFTNGDILIGFNITRNWNF